MKTKLNERIDLVSVLRDNYGIDKQDAFDIVRKLTFSDYLEFVDALRKGGDTFVELLQKRKLTEEDKILVPGSVVKVSNGATTEFGTLDDASTNGNATVSTSAGTTNVSLDKIAAPDEKETEWLQKLAGIK